MAVLDQGLRGGNGAEPIVDLREANPNVAVLILSVSLEPHNAERITKARGDEVLDKLASLTEVVATIRRLRSG